MPSVYWRFVSLIHFERLDVLLEKNREGTLTHQEMAELDTYERFEQVLSSRLCEIFGLQLRSIFTHFSNRARAPAQLHFE